MKRHLRVLRAVLLTALLCTTLAWSQEQPKTESVENPAHAELRQLRIVMQQAMNTLDIDLLLNGVTEDVVFSTMNGDVVKGKDAIRAYFEKMMTGPDAPVKSVTTDFEADDLTNLYGGDLGEREDAGVAVGYSKDHYVLKDGTVIDVQPRWSATMIREPDGWKIANFHYSVNMFDNPVVSKMKNLIMWGLGGGALVGLVIGGFLGFLWGRRKRS